MKKRLVIAVLACMTVMAIGLFGCGGGGDKYADDAHVGSWSAESVEYSGITLEAASLFDQFDINLEASGKASVVANIGGEEQSGSGKWEPSDNGVTLMDSGLSDESLEMTDSDGNLVLEYEEMSITFIKSA